jgi:hypothetical protein
MFFIGSSSSFQVSNLQVMLCTLNSLFYNMIVVTKFRFYNGPSPLKTDKKVIRFILCVSTVIIGSFLRRTGPRQETVLKIRT